MKGVPVLQDAVEHLPGQVLAHVPVPGQAKEIVVQLDVVALKLGFGDRRHTLETPEHTSVRLSGFSFEVMARRPRNL